MESEYVHESRNNEALRWLQDYNKEIQEVKQYREREILELLQNADDAGSCQVDISLDTANRLLTITNSGAGTIPFTEEGVKSIMYANVSPKKGSELIGAKGLGFRSVLNWAERITIISENIKIDFNPERIEEFWNNSMSVSHADKKKYEELAKNDHRKVPLALLALPLICEIPSDDKSTSIRLQYSPEQQEHIKKSLKSFVPTCLLFLHNIKQIRIEIDGETVAHYHNAVLSEHDGIQTSELAGKRWVMKRLEGKETIDGVEKRYETGCAYCLDRECHDTYPIYNFFPTHQDFGLPCILHATVELNSSRTELIIQDPTNVMMMEKLADVITDVAEYLKTSDDNSTWDAYRLMRPDIPYFEDSYRAILFKHLHAKKGAYIPLTGNGYEIKERCWYLNDDIYEIVSSREDGRTIFANMRKREEAGIQCTVSEDFSSLIRRMVEQFAQVTEDYAVLARFILALRRYAIDRNVNLDCHVFKNADGNIIEGRTYVNEGQKAEDIPSFLTFEYMGQELAEALKAKIAFNGDKPWQRQIADMLDIVGEISSSHISSITNLLIPKSKDAQRPVKEWQELLTSLFKIFVKRGDDFTVGEKNEAWLPTETGQWQRASMLIMADTRFHDELRNIGIASFPYPPERCVAYPEYLEEVPGCSPVLIQEFFVKLGVNLYFNKTLEHYGDDSDYIDSLGLSADVKENCSWKDKQHASKNTAEIADMEVMRRLKLPDLLTVIKVSGYYEDVCGVQKIHWFNQTYKTPVTVDLSYSAYLLRKYSAAAELKFYAVEDGEWLPGMKPYGIPDFDNTPATQRLLYALGAVRRWSDSTSEAIYKALQTRTMASKKEHDSTGLRTFYHKIKIALNEKGTPAPPDNLILACRKDGKLDFLPAREIYYSDNIGVRSLRKQLPVLEMSSREGEDIVKRVFGCRLFKDIKTVLHDAADNTRLTASLNLRLQTLKPYILAFASKNAGSKGGDSDGQLRDICAILDRLYIRVVSKAAYSIKDEGLPVDEKIEMENGDLQYFGGIPTLCSPMSGENEALADPHYCNGVVEAIGIALKLSGAENLDRFHRLIKSSPKELEYIASTEYDESVWERCLEIAGVSEYELSFWRNVFKNAGISEEFDEELLKTQRREYIAEKLNIPFELADFKSLALYHKQQLKKARSLFESPYLRHVHHSLSEKGEEAQATYINFRNEFCSEEWIAALHKEIEYQIRPDYTAIVRKYVADRFGFETDADSTSIAELPRRHDEYLLGHDFHELNLSVKDESLLYFDGKEEHFRNLIDDIFTHSRNNDNNELPENSNSGDSEEPESVILDIIDTVAYDDVLDRNHNPSHRSGSRQPSDRDKRRSGCKAEDMALKALRSSDYEIGMIYSEYLAQKEGQSGDDSKGYDLEYRRKGESLYRCLEIKNCSSESEIIVTSNEYNASQSIENHDRYDIALVSGNHVMIWENALKDPSGYTLVPEGYRVRFQIKNQTTGI